MNRLSITLLLACLITLSVADMNVDLIQKKQLFNEFKQTYNRNYATTAEENTRFEIFQQSLKRIDYLNSVSKHATFAVNKFADLSDLEFKEMYLNKPITADYAAQSCLAHGVSHQVTEEEVGDIPASFDWRTKGKVSEVKNQAACGSCWTFSTTGVIESAYAIKNNVDATLLLSEQAIVDCSHNCSMVNGESVCNQGCDGGWPWAAVTDVIRWGGLPTESEYPYTGVDGTCSRTGKQKYAAPASYTCVSGPDQKGGPADEKVVMPNALMNHGPLSIALDASMFQFYSSGVMDPYFPNYECSPTSLDHAVLIVGWGEYTSDLWGKQPYWTVKNSWGPSWGEKGYVRMFRGEGLCGLNAAVMYVTMK